MSELTLRRYRDADREAVWQLHNLALHDVGAHGGQGGWDDDLHNVTAEYLDSGGEFLVGECEGRLVAMGALLPVSGELARVKRMRVHPDYQRRGFGRRVLRELIDRARRDGYTHLELDTTTLQAAAQRLYESEGFVQTGTREFVNGPRRFTLKLYEKTL
jgi:ribosomal protein S18 acetylase RimI-like enzyme